MLVKSKGLGTVGSQSSKAEKRWLNWGLPMLPNFFQWGWEQGRKEERIHVFFLWIPCEVLTQLAGISLDSDQEVGYEVKELSVKRSWMPEEAIRQMTRWRNYTIPHKKTKLQVKNDHGWGIFKEEKEADMKKSVQL